MVFVDSRRMWGAVPWPGNLKKIGVPKGIL